MPILHNSFILAVLLVQIFLLIAETDPKLGFFVNANPDLGLFSGCVSESRPTSTSKISLNVQIFSGKYLAAWIR